MRGVITGWSAVEAADNAPIPRLSQKGSTVSASYAGRAAVCDVTKFTGTWVTPEPGAPSCSEQSGIDAVSLCIHRVMCPLLPLPAHFTYLICAISGAGRRFMIARRIRISAPWCSGQPETFRNAKEFEASAPRARFGRESRITSSTTDAPRHCIARSASFRQSAAGQSGFHERPFRRIGMTGAA